METIKNRIAFLIRAENICRAASNLEGARDCEMMRIELEWALIEMDK